MTAWSVTLATCGRANFGEDEAADMMEALAPYGPSVSVDPWEISVRFDVEAPSLVEALVEGARLFTEHYPDMPIAEGEAQTVEELERDLDPAGAPEYVGVAEVATAMGVSKQRVSELARTMVFPRPAATLASGPIWRTASIVRYLNRRTAKPGRPKRD